MKLKIELNFEKVAFFEDYKERGEGEKGKSFYLLLLF